MYALDMRQFLLALLMAASLFLSTEAQTSVAKITAQEYIEANELSREFFDRFVKTMDIKPLIEEFGTKDFYECIVQGDSAFVRREQVDTLSKEQKIRYYLTETNFMMAGFMWGTQFPVAEEDAFAFESLPKSVQTLITKKTYEAMIKNSDSDSHLSASETRRYLRKVLSVLERATPIFRAEAKKTRASKSKGFRDAMKFLEHDSTIAKYLFTPELSGETKTCGSVARSGRVLYTDIPPYFQLQMVKVNGRMRIHQMLFHID